MTVAIKVSGSARAIYHDVRVRVPAIRERVAVSAANKATKKVHTQCIRDIASTTGIKQQFLRGSNKKGVKGRVKFFKYAKRKGRARVWAGLSKIPLKKLNHSSKFGHYTSGSMQGRTAADVFEAKMPSGHVGYFVRKPGSKRLPIQEVVLDIKNIASTIVTRNGRRIGPAAFQKEFDRDLARRLKRR